MYKYLRKKVKSRDYFGRAISLNVDGEEEHKTWFGGVFSILILIFMLGYTFLMLRKCIDHKEDVMNFAYVDENPAKLGVVSYKELQEVIFFQLTTVPQHGENRYKRDLNKDHPHEPIVLNEDFYSKIDVRFEQVKIDHEQ